MLNQKNRNIKRFLSLLVVCVVLAGAALAAGGAQEFFPRKWNTRVVDLSFNHYYDWKEMETAMRKLEKAFPEFLKMQSIGKSFEGREIWYMTINNPDTGDEMDKCAFYMDANIHSLEVQGGEIGLYTRSVHILIPYCKLSLSASPRWHCDTQSAQRGRQRY